MMRIRKLINNRDELIERYNRKILEELQPVLLQPLIELFNVPEEYIEWADLQLIDNVLVIMCMITYDESDCSLYLQNIIQHTLNQIDIDENENEDEQLSSNEQSEGDQSGLTTKLVQIGIPIPFLLESPSTVKDFLVYANSISNPEITDEEVMATYESSRSFDTTNLSESQLSQLNLFNKTYIRSKH